MAYHAPPARDRPAGAQRHTVSDVLARWQQHGDHTVGGLIDAFEEKSFAMLFMLLLAPSALPVPTGGVTNALELIAMLVAAQLLAGRDRIWLPTRWRSVTLAGPRSERTIGRLLALLRFLERFSRPRLRFAFGTRLGNVAFGLLVILFTLGSFLAPPFSGLDTLPSMGVVLLSLGVLLEDMLLVALGALVGAVGVVLELLVGKAVLSGLKRLF